MNALHFERLHTCLGARVIGIDLTHPMDASTLEKIQTALDEYSLLYFPDQDMNDEAQLALTRQLGEPEPNHLKFGATGVIEYIGSIGNVIDAHTKKGNDDPQTRHQTGNNLWHTDSSFRPVPSKFSINHAYEVPGEGGVTQFASQRYAYSKLTSAKRAELEPLLALHDYVFSRSQVAQVDPNHAAAMPPVEHKLVRTNLRTGARNFYAGSHARSIVGWSGIDGRKLIDELLAHAVRPERVYAHDWQAGDTVIWDNRCLLHRGTGYDADRWRRLMRQSRVAGSGPTVRD
jgi:alpha-ketoglutarate-dependent 2,4-dichlorophenoxyacetate dioxygenase